MIRVIFLLILLLPLTLASPTLLAANNPKFASVGEARVNLGESLAADGFLDYLKSTAKHWPHLDVGYAYRGEAREPEVPVNIGPDIEVPESY